MPPKSDCMNLVNLQVTKINVQKFVAFLYGNSELAKVKFMQQPHL